MSESETKSEVKVETEAEKFDHLHPYPEIYYDDDEDVTDEDDEGFEDEPEDEFCPHGNSWEVGCDRCKDEIKEAMEIKIEEEEKEKKSD